MLPRLLHSLIATFQHHWIPTRHTKHNALRYGLCEDVAKMAACIDFADANWQCGADFELWLSQDLFVKLCHEATCGGTLCLKCWACPLVPPIVWPHPPHPHWICQLEDFRLARPSNWTGKSPSVLRRSAVSGVPTWTSNQRKAWFAVALFRKAAAHDQLSLWPYRMSSSQQRSTERKVQQCRACSSFASWDKIYCFLAQNRELDWSWHAWVRLSGSDSAKTEWWEMILDLCSHLVIGFQCKTSQKYSRRRSPIYFRPR